MRAPKRLQLNSIWTRPAKKEEKSNEQKPLLNDYEGSDSTHINYRNWLTSFTFSLICSLLLSDVSTNLMWVIHAGANGADTFFFISDLICMYTSNMVLDHCSAWGKISIEIVIVIQLTFTNYQGFNQNHQFSKQNWFIELEKKRAINFICHIFVGELKKRHIKFNEKTNRNKKTPWTVCCV